MSTEREQQRESKWDDEHREMAADYEHVHAALAECLGPLSDTENAQIFGKTAAEFYRLQI